MGIWTLCMVGLALAWLALWLRVNLTTLSATAAASLSWTATKSLTGTAYSAIANASTLRTSFGLGTTVANAVVGGADELASFITSIPASSSASIDTTAVTDILNQAAASFARLKLLMIRLLSVSLDATNGTAASSITLDNTVVNALSAQSNSGWFNNGAEGAVGGSKFTIPSGGVLFFGTPAAAGILVDATHKIIRLTNNDTSLAAKAETSFVGGST